MTNKTEAVLDTLEAQLDTIEDNLETVTEVAVETVAVVKNNPWVLGGVAVVAALAGVAVGYKIAERRVSLRYEKIANEEIATAKEFYSTLYKTGKDSTPESAVESRMADEAVTALRSYQGTPVVEGKDEVNVKPAVVLEQTEVTQNVFVVEDDGFDYEEEQKTRTYERPYVISMDEWMEAEPSFDQQQLTYFEGDDIVADDRDQMVDDVEATVGNANLLRFGQGSGDKNVVFVRNERVGLDMEIMRSQGNYAEEVLGIIEHSDKRRPRKPRRDDWDG